MKAGAVTGPGSARGSSVAFLGPVSSYTHQAALQAFPGDAYDLQPVAHIDDIFETIQRGEADYGVVPFENSTNGAVIFTLDNFANRSGTLPDVTVCGEVFVDVHHFLVGYKKSALSIDDAGDASGTCTPTLSEPHPLKPRAKPTGSLKHIQRLYSHPQAWGQCETFLSAYLRGVETIDVSSTSRAAELAKEDKTGTSAAVSSEIAAKMNGLDVLAESIEDREDNTTRFFVIRRTQADDKMTSDANPSQPTPSGDSRDHLSNPPLPTKTMVSFTVPHSSPGALADVLDCFRTRKLNLTSINSRPSLISPFQYLFFVEFEGHRDIDPEGRVKGALADVSKLVHTWRWLGSWVTGRGRPSEDSL